MNTYNSASTSHETRRSFLKKAATAAAVVSATNPFKTPVYGQNQAPSPGRVVGANDRIAVAYVGVGGQGMAHVRSQKDHASENNIAQVAVCDVWQKRLDAARDFLALPETAAYRDHRKLLERNDIDAIVVATVDNWHAAVAIDAMNAGKHVYGEKPLARYLEEGFEIFDTVKRTGKVFQMGSQYCADPMFHKAAEWIKAGTPGLRLLDLREGLDTSTYMIPGARSIALRDLDTLRVADGEGVILYSDGAAHAAQAWVLLRVRGIRNALVLKDGMASWEDEVLSPLTAAVTDDSAQARFKRARELSLWFGGFPRLVPDETLAGTVRPRRRRTC
jgi:rhodanese-related sulfurtransferase